MNRSDFARIVAAQRENTLDYMNHGWSNGWSSGSEIMEAFAYAQLRIARLEEAIKGFVAAYADKWEMIPGCGDNVAQVLSSDVFKLEQALADQEAT